MTHGTVHFNTNIPQNGLFIVIFKVQIIMIYSTNSIFSEITHNEDIWYDLCESGLSYCCHYPTKVIDFF